MINGLPTDFMNPSTKGNYSYYFLYWLTGIFTLLFFVPIFLFLKQILLAKLVGFSSLIIVSLALLFWKSVSRKRNQVKNRIVLNTNDLFWLQKNISFYNNLTLEDQQVIENRIGLFLVQTEVSSEIDDKYHLIYLAVFDLIVYWEDLQLNIYRKQIDLIATEDPIFERNELGFVVSLKYITDLFFNIETKSTTIAQINKLVVN
jgi:hypothetical protein